MKRIFFTISVLLIFTNSVMSQIVDPVKWKTTSKSLEDGMAEITFNATIDMHWHLYSQYFEVRNQNVSYDLPWLEL